MKSYIIFFVTLGLTWTLTAQGILQQLPDAEKEAIEAVALYPAHERAAVLTVAQHPEILVRMDLIRQTTETAFTELISGLTETDQKKVYNLSRYPDLLAAMAERDARWSDQELDGLLHNYVKEIHEDAHALNRKYFSLLVYIHALDMRAEDDFIMLLTPYPQEVRDAARQLTQLPAVLSVLSTHMNMTVLLGDLYRRHPEQLNHELDSLNIVVAEQQAKDLEGWKKELEENPEAKAEYETAAKEFAGEEQAYDDDVYDGPIPTRYREVDYMHYVWRPYSYWFGWPAWYGYECWYPYPWWYHWGYYYGPGQVMVIIGLPSNYFFDWHFRHHHHFYHYPHFTDHIFRHYYGPRSYGARVQPVLRQWEQAHRGELPANWMNDDKDRIIRIREYGKFRMEYDEIVRISRDKAPTQREYLRENANRYPSLKPVLREKPEPPRNQPPGQDPRKRSTEPQRQPTPGEPPTEKGTKSDTPPRQEEVDRAKETHENIWDHLRKEPQPQPPSPSTTPTRKEPPKSQPRTAPAKKEQPKQQPPPRKKDTGGSEDQ